MLNMMDYDLKGGDHKALADAVRRKAWDEDYGLDLNVRFAPWFLVSDADAVTIRDKLLETKRELRRDRFLILPLGKRTLGKSWHFNPAVRAWLGKYGIEAPPGKLADNPRCSRVVGLSYTLYLGERQEYGHLVDGLTEAFPDSCKPLHAMWFLYTDLPLAKVIDRLESLVPGDRVQQHQALAVDIPDRIEGAQARLHADDVRWFAEHGISLN